MTSAQFFGLYNYWVVVFLMMTGFYIVIARGNLIKSVIGLNIFQTSVFLLYISMGKINGATAPIIPPALTNGHASHSVLQRENEPHPHGSQSLPPTSKKNVVPDNTHGAQATISPAIQEIHQTDDRPPLTLVYTNDTGDLHDRPSYNSVPPEIAEQFAGTTLEPMMRSGQVTYSNPLPSVLMLTAIVVGISTTALALALIVRIREDYGTIEEDEILQIDRNSAC